MNNISRRKIIKYLAAGVAYASLPKAIPANQGCIQRRIIPSLGEKIGVVGLGTYLTFNVGSSENERNPLKEVLNILTDGGGSVIDSSPMYGASEKVVGDLINELCLEKSAFLATKVWTTGRRQGIEQMERSMKKMRACPMDLMQVHNLQDWKTHLSTLYDWKEKGLIRYIGITHYVDSAHYRLEKIIKDEKIDFVQVNYSINNRNAEKSLLPVCTEKGVAVIANQPYSSGSLFRLSKGKNLPEWSREFDCKSWGQFFLKYLLSNPAVTCVIPGTSKPHHMKDNMGAGMGRLPNEDHKIKMLRLIESL